jgi:hypothetical protein
MNEEVIENTVSRLIKKIPNLPYAEEIYEHFRKILILTIEEPAMGREALISCSKYFDDLIDVYLGEKLLLSKGQYIAIAGDAFIDQKMILKILAQYGMKKSNVKFCLDYKKYKNGHYTDILYSSQCIAVILGPVPHSAKDTPEKILRDKIFEAIDSTGKLKLTKESLTKILPNVVSFVTKKE